MFLFFLFFKYLQALYRTSRGRIYLSNVVLLCISFKTIRKHQHWLSIIIHRWMLRTRGFRAVIWFHIPSYYCYLFPYYFFQMRSGQLIYVVNLSFNLLVVVLCSNIYTCNCFPLHNTEKKSLLFVMQQLKGIIFNVYGDINVIISTIKPKRLHRIWSRDQSVLIFR